MNGYPTPICALDITEEALSAWHDGLLAAGEAERLASHVGTCAACQARLADFQALGHLLRQQWTPNLQARIWRGLRHAMEGDGMRGMKGRERAIWGTTAAVVAAVLVVALFAGLLARRAGQSGQPGSGTTLLPTPTATATATPTPTAA
ncbi:MAG TPA: zf-HC2 domain-containing protein, partial [Ktedonobacterales bacterium]